MNFKSTAVLMSCVAFMQLNAQNTDLEKNAIKATECVQKCNKESSSVAQSEACLQKCGVEKTSFENEIVRASSSISPSSTQTKSESESAISELSSSSRGSASRSKSASKASASESDSSNTNTIKYASIPLIFGFMVASF